MEIKAKLIWMFILTAVSLSGCGFHLRGSYDLSVNLPAVSLQGISRHSDTGRLIVSSLQRANVDFVADEMSKEAKVKAVKANAELKTEKSVPGSKTAQLVITQDTVDKRILSLDNTGRANQYELKYQLSFLLVGENGKERIGLNNISLRREYLYDSNLVLAKATEEQRLIRDMRNQAVQQLMRRLVFTLRKQQATKNTMPVTTLPATEPVTE